MCALNEGRSTSFACPDHGWRFETDGTLRSAPAPEGYDTDCRAAMKRLSLRRVARVESYRGSSSRASARPARASQTSSARS